MIVFIGGSPDWNNSPKWVKFFLIGLLLFLVFMILSVIFDWI